MDHHLIDNQDALSHFDRRIIIQSEAHNFESQDLLELMNHHSRQTEKEEVDYRFIYQLVLDLIENSTSLISHLKVSMGSAPSIESNEEIMQQSHGDLEIPYRFA